MSRAAPLLPLILAKAAFAHGGQPHDTAELISSWSFDPPVVVLLIVAAAVYVLGTLKVWRGSETGSGITTKAAVAYTAGWLSLVIALVSPVHTWGEVLFSAHMTQHEILMLISAPLLVLGRPLIATLWATPRDARLWIGQAVQGGPVLKTWRLLTDPAVAFLVHGIALWTWHIPFLFQATIESDVVHTLQHASFLGSALLLWWAIIYGRRGVASYGAGVLYLFITSVHSGILGAFLTFTPRLWYPIYAPTTIAWGVSPLEDQQLGGLIMWVPAGIVYIVAALIMFAAWIGSSEERALGTPKRPLAARS
jgi:cytochrome c oxidase assembly factor CtaG